MEINVEKTKGNENTKAAIPTIDYDRTKPAGECGIFQMFLVA
jgi:hypothetical protein